VPAPLIAEMLGCSEGVVARWLPKKRPREEGEGGEGCQDGATERGEGGAGVSDDAEREETSGSTQRPRVDL